MQNEEKMLTTDDAYDAIVDYLEKYYRKTKSEDALLLGGDMNLFADGRPADPALENEWARAVDKLIDQQPSLHQSFELAGKKLTTKQAYEAMIIFLDTYHYFTEIVTMLSDMRLSNDGMPKDPEAWISWIESVDKILSQNPRSRPLLFGINTKILTTHIGGYDTMVGYLNEYYNRTKANDIKTLLKSISRPENGEFTDSTIQSDWNKAVDMTLKQNIHENKDAQLAENGLSATEGYNAVINFLNIYNHKVNSNEIITLLSGMKSTDPEPWYSWLESVNKTLNKYRTF